MLFNSFSFLVFLVTLLSIYFFLPKKWQIVLCLIGSYIFYGWWDYRFLSLIIASTLIDFFVGKNLDKIDEPRKRKLLLFVSVLFNLTLLGFFKYFNFFIDTFENVSSLLGINSSKLTLNIILPVGISFYTFQTMSYTIDIYYRKLKHERSLIIFATYVAFFPQLVAGPIVRASTLLPQFAKRHSFNLDRFYSGFGLILVGYFKKIVVADSIALIVDKVYENPEFSSPLQLWIVVIFYSFQIYCDFSAYSDIAIGIARIMGFDFPKNFNFPYFSKSFSDFWKRWHISLSSWLRDYLYIPLGGNQGSKLFVYRNLMLTMLLGGLWHGASWTFVVWGAMHGTYLILQRVIMEPFHKFINLKNSRLKTLALVPNVLLIFFAVSLTWIFFRSDSFDKAFYITEKIFSLDIGSVSFASLKNKFVLVECFLLISALISGELISLFIDFDKLFTKNVIFRYLSVALLFFSILIFGKFGETQFIYFQF